MGFGKNAETSAGPLAPRGGGGKDARLAGFQHSLGLALAASPGLSPSADIAERSTPLASCPAVCVPTKGGFYFPSFSGSLAVSLGSGLSATAVGVHLAAWAQPWVDLSSLLLRLDLGLFSVGAPSSPAASATSPVTAASAAGLLGSSLAAADALGGRFPALVVLCVVATALIVLSTWASPSGSSPPPFFWALPAFRACCKGLSATLQRHLRRCLRAAAWRAAKALKAPPVSLIPAFTSLWRSARVLLGAVRAVMAPITAISAVVPLLFVTRSSGDSTKPATPRSLKQSQSQAEASRCTDNDATCTGSQPQWPSRICSRDSGLGEGSADALRTSPQLRGSGTPLQAAFRSSFDSTSTLNRSSSSNSSCSSVMSFNESQDCMSSGGEMHGPGPQERVAEADLEELVSRLEPRESHAAEGPWELIVDKASASVDYCAWRRDPSDGGPTEYKSWTRFYGCTAERLCAFYLDCEHLCSWEAMVRSYNVLDFNRDTGEETGCFVKKYPLCSPREYVLAWRVWRGLGDGPTGTFYCVTKAVEHPLAPRLPSQRRVEVYRCGWRIREVMVENVGWSAEVDMYIQEDSGMQRSMAKLAFRRSIWGYIQTSDVQLRLYPGSSSTPPPSTPPPTPVSGTETPGAEGRSAFEQLEDTIQPSRGLSLPLSVEHASTVPVWLENKDARFQQQTSEADWASTVESWNAERLSTCDASGALPHLAGIAPLCASLGGQHLSEQSGTSVPARRSALARRGSGGPSRGPGRQRASDSCGWVAHVRRTALPVLAAAAAGLGTVTVARGPAGLAARLLLACAVKMLTVSGSAVPESPRPVPRLVRGSRASRSRRQGQW